MAMVGCDFHERACIQIISSNLILRNISSKLTSSVHLFSLCPPTIQKRENSSNEVVNQEAFTLWQLFHA